MPGEKGEEPGPLGLTVKGKHLTFNPRLSSQWASLVAQLLKSLPAMWETWVRSLGWENALEKGKATHSSIPT